jgi:glycosyltransferase involved in cell wall biosynthesis
VWVCTYNHAHFIKKCLDSILSQETEYTFEICLGEDSSTDGTRDICIQYADKFPNTIRLFLRDRNDPKRAGCAGNWQFNFIETFKACRGKYIAMCDGDDYWSDPLKLQKQVDFLEINPECSGCYHKIGIVDEDDNIVLHDTGYPPRKQNYYSLDYLLRYSIFSPMLSVVFRNRAEVAPSWIKTAPFGDLIIHAGNLRMGDYGFIDEVMGYYRIHKGGMASGSPRYKNVRATIQAYRLIGSQFNLMNRASYRAGIRALKLSYIAEILLECFLNRNIKHRLELGLIRKLRTKIRRYLNLER